MIEKKLILVMNWLFVLDSGSFNFSFNTIVASKEFAANG